MTKYSTTLLLALCGLLVVLPTAFAAVNLPEQEPCDCPTGFKQYCTRWEEGTKRDFGYELNHAQFGALTATLSPEDADKCIEFACLRRFDVHGNDHRNAHVSSVFDQKYPMSRQLIKYKKGTALEFEIVSDESTTSYTMERGTEEWTMEEHKYRSYKKGTYEFVTKFTDTAPEDQHVWIWINLKCPVNKLPKQEACPCPSGFKQYCTRWEAGAQPDFGYELNHIAFRDLPETLSPEDADKCVEFACLRRFDVHGQGNAVVTSEFTQRYPMSRQLLKYKKGTAFDFEIESDESTVAYTMERGTETWNMESTKYRGYKKGTYKFVTKFTETAPTDQHAWIWVNLKCPVKTKVEPKITPCACPEGFVEHCTKQRGSDELDYGYSISHRVFKNMDKELSEEAADNCEMFSCVRQFDVHGNGHKHANVKLSLKRTYGQSRHFMKYKKGTEFLFSITTKGGKQRMSRNLHGPGSDKINMEEMVSPGEIAKGNYSLKTRFYRDNEGPSKSWNWINLSCEKPVVEW